MRTNDTNMPNGAGDPDAPQSQKPKTIGERSSGEIGRYKLLQKIGEGGFGEVWMAEQREPVRRRVALKIIKLGMDTRQVVARFEAERQALALMDHPHIAKVLDGGATESGRPFFVMELVRGIRITDYCNKNHVPTRQRLELFIQVCKAIQHAHQKGIIHRDIKPSNILVTLHDGVAVPKVIDFGIAKATQGDLTEKTLFTQFQHFIGTPAYISPEQAEMTGLDIDTRSDIYSLGVLLYELLTGRTPFDSKELVKRGIEELILTLRDVEPPRPSTCLSAMTPVDIGTLARLQECEVPRLVQLLRGDLDWIVMKCLEKDRARRYETANGLAMDIQRYMNNEPIVARPPTVSYRMKKALRRNRLLSAAAAVVALVLVGGGVVSTWQAFRATRAEREQAFLLQHAQINQKKTEQARENEAEARAATVRLLYDSLLRESSALRSARRVGYRARVFSLLRQANALDVPGRSLPRLRSEAIACLGDFVGLTPVTFTNITAESGIRMVAFDAASRFVAFSLWDPIILMHQLPSGKNVARLRVENPVRSMRFEGASDRLVLVGVPNGPSLADRIQGSLVHYWKRNSAGHWIEEEKVALPGAFVCLGSGKPRFLALVDPSLRSLRLLDVQSRDFAHSIGLSSKLRGFPKLDLSPDGRYLALEEMEPVKAGTFAVSVWDLQAGKRIQLLEAHLSEVLSLQFSPDGKYLALLCEGGGKIYTTAGYRPLGLFRDYFEEPSGIAFWPDSTTIGLPMIQQNRIRLWNWASGQDVAVLDEPKVPLLAAFASDGRHLLSAGARHARIYSLDLDSEKLSLPGHVGGVPATAFSPDGQRIASVGKDGSLMVRNAVTGDLLWENKDLPAPGQSLDFSPQGRFLVTTDYETALVLIWDAHSGDRLLELGGRHEERIWSALFSPDGQYLATASAGPNANAGIKIWTLEMPGYGGDRPRLLARLFKSHPGACRSLQMSPDSRRVAFLDRGGGDARGLYDWEFLTETPPRRLRTNLIETVQSESFTPDGSRLLLVDRKRNLETVDIATGATLFSVPTLDPGHPGSATGYPNISLSPDGTKLAMASASSLGVDIWDPRVGDLLYSLPEHTGTIWWLTWAPDSRRLAVSCANGEIAIWSMGEIEKILADLEL